MSVRGSGVRVDQVGDFNVLRRVVQKNLIPKAADRTVRELSKKIIQDVRRGLMEQTFDHQALSPAWRTFKEERGFDSRILLMRHEYVNSFKSRKIEDGKWAVGVPDVPNSDGVSLSLVGKVHEYGAETPRGTIPARPHWRPVLGQNAAGYNRFVGGAMKDAANGAVRDTFNPLRIVRLV